MSFSQNDTYLVGATRVVVGLSTLVKMKADANQNSFAFKIISGGTLEIVAPPLALSGSSAAGWSLGYPVGTNEALNIQGPATYYLAATGATVVAGVLISHTQGATISV